MTEQGNETTGQGNEPASTRSADLAPTPQTPTSSGAVSPEKQKATRRRKMLLGAAGAVVLAAVLVVGIPWILEALNTVSTDDAYVNGHVTFVAGRVRGQVARVLVDDNNRVHQGDLLVELDKEPYRTAVAVKRAAVDTAKADLLAATATVRGIEAEARSRHWNLQHAMEDVANQDRRTACAGCRRRQEQGGADTGRARIRAGKAAGGDRQYSPVGVRSPASDPGDRARRAGPDPGRRESDLVSPWG